MRANQLSKNQPKKSRLQKIGEKRGENTPPRQGVDRSVVRWGYVLRNVLGLGTSEV